MRTLSGYRRFCGELLLAVCDDDTSTNCSVGLVRTVGGICFTGVLGKTAGKAQSMVTGGTFSATGEGKLVELSQHFLAMATCDQHALCAAFDPLVSGM